MAHGVIVELTDDGGVVGRGEAAPISRYKESVKTVEAFLQKVDAERLSAEAIPETMLYLDRLAPREMAAKCAINIALMDIAAKRARKPVCDFLKLGFHENQHLTSYTIGLGTPEVTRAKVIAAAEFPVLKVKIGNGNDNVMLNSVREVAPDKIVRIDANEAWPSKEEALHKIEVLAGDRRIEFVEQPLPAATPPKDWVWLKERSPLPIFADESHHLATDTAHAAECFHGVNVKLVKSGGISGAVEALKAARKAGLKTMLGCMIETSLLITAAAHLAELCDYLDLDGNLLIANDPYVGVTAKKGMLSFAGAPEKLGLRVSERPSS